MGIEVKNKIISDFYGNLDSPSFQLDNKNRIKVINNSKRIIGNFSIEEIVDIGIDICCKEKNTRKGFSIMPSYNKVVFVEKMTMFITLRNGHTYTAFYIPNSYTGKNINCQDVQNKKRQMEKFKLFVDDARSKFVKKTLDITQQPLKEDINIIKMTEELKAFKELLDCDIITKKEFDERKELFLKTYDANNDTVKKYELKNDNKNFKSEPDNIINQLEGEHSKIISINDNKVQIKGEKSNRIIDIEDIKIVNLCVMTKFEGEFIDIYEKIDWVLESIIEPNLDIASIQLHVYAFLTDKGEERKINIYKVPKDRSINSAEVKNIVKQFEKFKSNLISIKNSNK